MEHTFRDFVTYLAGRIFPLRALPKTNVKDREVVSSTKGSDPVIDLFFGDNPQGVAY